MKALLPKTYFLIGVVIIAFLSACQNSTAGVEQESAIGGQMILATTTSTYDSGLLDELIPQFTEKTGVHVQIIAVGSGQALSMAENGEADVLLVHSPMAEAHLEEARIVINRHPVMHNDFVFVGPLHDPARIQGSSIEDALTNISEGNASFFSRGDDSGTHKKELELWKKAGIHNEFTNYQESGQGMGNTLRIAAERGGYSLTDRSTYLFLKSGLDSLKILLENEKELANIYHVMQVNPALFERINSEAAEAFVTFLLSDETQQLISEYGLKQWGQPLFSAYLQD